MSRATVGRSKNATLCKNKRGLETLYGRLGDNSGLIGPPAVKRFNVMRQFAPLMRENRGMSP